MNIEIDFIPEDKKPTKRRVVILNMGQGIIHLVDGYDVKRCDDAIINGIQNIQSEGVYDSEIDIYGMKKNVADIPIESVTIDILWAEPLLDFKIL